MRGSVEAGDKEHATDLAARIASLADQVRLSKTLSILDDQQRISGPFQPEDGTVLTQLR